MSERRRTCQAGHGRGLVAFLCGIHKHVLKGTLSFVLEFSNICLPTLKHLNTEELKSVAAYLLVFLKSDETSFVPCNIQCKTEPIPNALYCSQRASLFLKMSSMRDAGRDAGREEGKKELGPLYRVFSNCDPFPASASQGHGLLRAQGCEPGERPCCLCHWGWPV